MAGSFKLSSLQIELRTFSCLHGSWAPHVTSVLGSRNHHCSNIQVRAPGFRFGGLGFRASVGGLPGVSGWGVIGSRVESDFQAYALALEGNTDAVPKPAFDPDLPHYSNTLRVHVAGSMVSGLVCLGFLTLGH